MGAKCWTVYLLAIIWCLEISASEVLFPAPCSEGLENVNFKKFGIIALILISSVVGGLVIFFLCKIMVIWLMENCYPRAQMFWFARNSYETI